MDISKQTILLVITICLVPTITGAAEESTIKGLLANYQGDKGLSFSAKRGEKLWNQTYSGKPPAQSRSCTTCHGRG